MASVAGTAGTGTGTGDTAPPGEAVSPQPTAEGTTAGRTAARRKKRNTEPQETNMEKVMGRFGPEFGVLKEYLAFSGVGDEELVKQILVTSKKKEAKVLRFQMYRKMASWWNWPVRTPFAAAIEAAVKFIWPEEAEGNYKGFIPDPNHDPWTSAQHHAHHDAVLQMIRTRRYDLDWNPLAEAELLSEEQQAGASHEAAADADPGVFDDDVIDLSIFEEDGDGGDMQDEVGSVITLGDSDDDVGFMYMNDGLPGNATDDVSQVVQGATPNEAFPLWAME